MFKFIDKAESSARLLVIKKLLLFTNKYIKNIYNDESLNLLKKKAFNADFKVPERNDQKFIKKNEVSPINSQPKIKEKKFPATSNVIILIAKNTINIINDETY